MMQLSCRGLPGFKRALLVWALMAVAATPPANALEIFGYKLFGSSDEEDAGVVDPIRYKATLVTDGMERDLADKLKDVSLLMGKEDVPPSGTVGLIARARDDQANLIAQIYEEGRFEATVSIVIGGRRLEDIAVTDVLPGGKSKLAVTITVSAGPRFRFGRIRVEGDEQREAAADAGLESGKLASTRAVLAAETAIVTEWQKLGHPYAKVSKHEVIADHATRTVDVAIMVAPGPVAILDGVKVTGTDRLDPGFVARQADIPQGVVYHPDIIEHARKNLAKLDALASISVKVAERTDASGHVPVLIEVSERKLHTVGGGVSYSSIDGAGGEAYWEHRDLFGEAETLRFEAEVGRVFEADNWDDYDGRFAILFDKPGVWGPDTRLDLTATILQEDPDPYNRRGAVFEASLTRDLTEHLSLTGGLTYDWARIDDAFGRNTYSIVSVPLILQYDSRDNVLDPTSGMLGRLRGEPEISVDSTALFFTADSELRYYLSLDDDHRFVLAARGLAGSTVGADLVDIPAHRRFYAGGGGSVRGYEYLNIGPRIEGFGATGGLGRVEGSLEARVKVSDTIGVVPFIDAGLVTAEADFTGDDEFGVGVGLGVRYYTSVGPLRVDVAFPLNPRSGDPDFAVYFGIGQAF
jgi:translocation and assembly module TamA